MPRSRGRQETDLYVICYDISDDHRRTRVHKALSGFGAWRQYSLFECYLTRKQYLLLQAKLAKLLKPAEDHIRLYQLCQGCEHRVEVLGGPKPEDPKAFLV